MSLNARAGQRRPSNRKQRTHGPESQATQELERAVAERTAELVHGNERLRAEVAEREEAEATLRTIIETEPECVKLLDREGRVLQMNPAGLAMIDADSLDSVLGRCVYPLVVEKDRPRFMALTEAVFRGRSGTLEFDLVGLKGRRRSMETHQVPLRNRRGDVIAALAITRDVTERKLAEASLRESEQRFRKIFEEGPLGMALIGADYRFLSVNPTLCQWWDTAQPRCAR
jgi:hypothetical protein